MTESVEHLLFELMKRIQAEQSLARDRHHEVITRLSQLETSVARIGRENAHAFAEQIEDRHQLDGVKLRLERIERRLEIDS